MSKKSMSISMKMSGKKTSIPHNNREMKEGEWKQKRNQHIDRNRVNDNVILKQVDIEDIYEQRFGDAVVKYNAKQKRKDRKVDNYYKQVKDSKKTNEQQEMIIHIGDMDDILAGDLDHDEAREVLEEWFKGFEERNPNLAVYNAVIHMDEIYEPDGKTVTTPHIHLNFVPVASGYKRGLEKQVAFDRALIQQDGNYDKTKPFKDWRQSEVNVMAKIMKTRGIERKEVGTHESMSVDRYKQVKDRERANVVESNRLASKELALLDRENMLDEREKALRTSLNAFKEHVQNSGQELQEIKNELLKECQSAKDIWAKIEDYDGDTLRMAKMTARAGRATSEMTEGKLQGIQGFSAEDLEDLNEETPQEHATNPKQDDVSQSFAQMINSMKSRNNLQR